MCGITGMVDLINYVREKRDTLIGMTETLTTNGVADVWFSTFVGFGYKRSNEKRIIQKKANGNMYSIVYSGMLNNSTDIRNSLLEKGHIFHTVTDAETILTSFIEWQEDCLEYLIGNFDIAVWNDNDQELFLASGQGGDKSIFYVQDSQHFIFGTELDPIVKYHKVSLKNIQELTLGHSLFFSKGTKILEK